MPVHDLFSNTGGVQLTVMTLVVNILFFFPQQFTSF